MVLIGLTETQKKREILRYIERNHPQHIVVFYPPQYPLDLPELPDGIAVETVAYSEIIMYRTFYPLLEKIDGSYLLIVNELLRDRNRSNLTYNCLRHYLNQCGGQLIFEFFPFIEKPDEFMALLDFDTKSKHKGMGFDPSFLESYNVLCAPHRYTFTVRQVDLPEVAQEEYQKKRDDLFDQLGNKSPDTVPRNLHLWVGKYKRNEIRPENQYVARNSRFGLPNVVPYEKVARGAEYILIDLPYKQLAMNDFLRSTGQTQLTFLSTGLSVDRFYESELQRWIERLEEFYASAGLYIRDC